MLLDLCRLFGSWILLHSRDPAHVLALGTAGLACVFEDIPAAGSLSHILACPLASDCIYCLAHVLHSLTSSHMSEDFGRLVWPNATVHMRR